MEKYRTQIIMIFKTNAKKILTDRNTHNDLRSIKRTQTQKLKTNMTINADRLQSHFEQMSEIGKLGETGTCRPTMTPTEKQAFELASLWMQEAGMTTRIDNFGNLIGRLEGTKPKLPILMMGSHLDSQPYGGRFDGVAGVLCAIEAATALTEQGIKPERSIEVVSFADEEGWRFNKGLFGSRGILGRLEEGELDRTDKDGITRRQALIDFGCDPNKFSESEYAAGSIHCFLELHIEQGPVLDLANKPIGVVSGISGPLWLTVKLKGMAGHAGSVPMPIRQDALVGAAEIIVALRQIATQIPGAPTVGTVGTINVFPSSRNIIAEEATFTVDLRDIDLNRRNRYEAQLREQIEGICSKHNLTYSITEDWNSEPRYCANWLKQIVHKQCSNLNLNAPELMSGPFHDAMALSYAADYAMIFVRCKDGISHNPLEFASYEDLALGAEVLYGTVLEVLGE
ncbi:MAG: Zn-dependent hydrolase [Segetibacter sp.]|nr:Zn-dependent hydrolase [Segetibacter sp.]